ncbi:MAG: tyrosine-type recombinase/integrase [Blautia sp.]|uniref:tyrosine-type recombinase/integrase n=1 Tax=Blautia sp. TaxID=1955243 RepID=UPI0025C0C84C|nr:tyrosine-type recombinase/integrase [Blautia sp.]MCI7448697.1 tyrosine-type recombinase/integrase [Blautia sp.]
MRKRIQMSSQSNLSIQEAHERFLKKCAVKNLSETTIKTYNDHFKIFAKFAHESQPIRNIKPQIVDDYILFLRDSYNWQDVTINSHLRSLRAFLYYCMSMKMMPEFKIQLIKAEKKIKETYSDAELELLLKKPNLAYCNFTEYKTWVFENYLLATGNRISTALNVKIQDVDLENGVIRLAKTKNRKQQLIPLSHALAEILVEYVEVRGGSPDDYLFCGACGEKAATRTFQDNVANYNHRRGVTKTSCHAFRHTFAKHWILNGGDVFRLQKILGHSDLSVTREYVNMFAPDLQMDFERFNPLDNLRANEKKEKITMKK